MLASARFRVFLQKDKQLAGTENVLTAWLIELVVWLIPEVERSVLLVSNLGGHVW